MPIVPSMPTEMNEVIFVLFFSDKKCAFMMIKNGFSSSAGWTAKKPKLIQRFEPLMLPLVNKTTPSRQMQMNSPAYDMLRMEMRENIDTSSIMEIPTRQKNTCLTEKWYVLT